MIPLFCSVPNFGPYRLDLAFWTKFCHTRKNTDFRTKWRVGIRFSLSVSFGFGGGEVTKEKARKKKEKRKKDEEVKPRIFDGVMVKIEKYEEL